MKSFILNTFMADLLNIFRLYLDKLDKKTVKIKLTIPPDIVSVSADIDQLSQILFNLLSIVTKSVAEGEISFGYNKLQNTDIEFFISQKDFTIQADASKENFNNFLRDVSYKQSAFHGLSFIELSIVKLFAEQLGSNISFDSGQAEGRTFRFKLWNIINTDYTGPVDSLSVNNIFSASNTILVAEDDEQSMFLITHLLDKLDIKYLKAYDGEEALKLVEENQDINLIILDISMPVMDGFDALQGIKLINPALPVIALSAYPDSEYRDRAIEAGFSDYLSKPIQKLYFAECLRKYLILLTYSTVQSEKPVT